MDKLAKIKKVKLKKSQFSLICEDLSHISSYTLPMDRSVFRILSNSLPGPFTFILNASNKVSKLFSTNRKEVGVRIPNHNIPKEIVKKLGHPLISSSVHNEDEILEYNTDPNSIFERFGNEVDIIVDCGYGKNIASTIVDCTNVDISILRQGMGILDD
jgi:tRNA threonylcarbamoyl adenosine modification protein (Sua5/YciO/YrdC/YwlC family)